MHPSCLLLLPVTQAKLSTIMEHATRGLNVKVDSQWVFVACDIEGHYLVDLARPHT